MNIGLRLHICIASSRLSQAACRKPRAHAARARRDRQAARQVGSPSRLAKSALQNGAPKRLAKAARQRGVHTPGVRAAHSGPISSILLTNSVRRSACKRGVHKWRAQAACACGAHSRRARPARKEGVHERRAFFKLHNALHNGLHNGRLADCAFDWATVTGRAVYPR